MLPLVNEYSLFLVGLVVIALVLLLTWKWFGLKWGLTGMVIVVVALAAFQFITSTNVNTVSSREELDRPQAGVFVLTNFGQNQGRSLEAGVV